MCVETTSVVDTHEPDLARPLLVASISLSELERHFDFSGVCTLKSRRAAGHSISNVAKSTNIHKNRHRDIKIAQNLHRVTKNNQHQCQILKNRAAPMPSRQTSDLKSSRLNKQYCQLNEHPKSSTSNRQLCDQTKPKLLPMCTRSMFWDGMWLGMWPFCSFTCQDCCV